MKHTSTAAAVVFALASGPALAANSGETGKLVCERIPGTSVKLLIHSSTGIRCTFHGSGDAEQWYKGKTGVALGIDLKWEKEETMHFGVLSSTVDYAPEGEFLTGKYAGGEAGVAFGPAVGAAVLVGGSNDTLALQPAVKTGKGFGASAGLSFLNLKSDPLNDARIVTPRGDLFDKALYAGYFDRAFITYHNGGYEGSDYFSARAMTAAAGEPVAPEDVARWDIDGQKAEGPLAARRRLATALADSDSAGAEPELARAQVAYDCWIQALGSGSSEAATCQVAYEGAIANVESFIAKEKSAVAKRKSKLEAGWHSVFFATDKSELDDYAGIVIADVMQAIQGLKSAKVYVHGNTDRVGNKAYNLALSQKRADSVVTALIAAGLQETWIVATAYGENDPVSISQNPHDALNRRVDVVVAPIEVDPNAVN